MFEMEKQENREGEWSGEERKEGREESKYCFFSFYFKIIVSINEGYFWFSSLLIYFLWRFIIIFFEE